MPKSRADVRLVLSPELQRAPVLDRMCSHFVLTLTMRDAGRFNLRRDWSNLLALTGRHLVWPATVLARLRAFLQSRQLMFDDLGHRLTIYGMESDHLFQIISTQYCTENCSLRMATLEDVFLRVTGRQLRD